ncbi:hypothetical protein TeGR_g4322 [Tetraparma gracilis]|uniref:Uncharacterized protein n=1 Tax=Tetraparma gracilis TaxID=2962635 RepID=A0ABQ6M4G7_9STRA|nr:hypothetical protein TeGR_g4322 [Tetraparma gracilis]
MCRACLDKLKFGGRGTLKRGCERRQCMSMVTAGSGGARGPPPPAWQPWPAMACHMAGGMPGAFLQPQQGSQPAHAAAALMGLVQLGGVGGAPGGAGGAGAAFAGNLGMASCPPLGMVHVPGVGLVPGVLPPGLLPSHLLGGHGQLPPCVNVSMNANAQLPPMPQPTTHPLVAPHLMPAPSLKKPAPAP